MQRLKKIDQSGIAHYCGHLGAFSRYDHSIGVYVLLKTKTDAKKLELIAGLLHDVSHTAFSHVGDHLFHEAQTEESYQDIVHVDFLKSRPDIQKIMQEEGIAIEDLDPDLPDYNALEAKLPKPCADRIQYIVHTGRVFKDINEEEGKAIIENIQFDSENEWYFTEQNLAKKFAYLSLKYTQNFWSSDLNTATYEYFTSILRHAIELGVITEEDIKQGSDKEVLAKLKRNDRLEKKYAWLKNIPKYYTVANYDQGDCNMLPKFRGVNPKVKVGDSFYLLTDIDDEYRKNTIR
jgi:HD superfamily phosphohydrolase